MTENTATNAPAGFNLEDWLLGGTEHRAHKKAVIYRDASIAGRIEEVEAKLKLARQNAEEGNSMDSLGDSTISDLEREQEALIEQIENAKAEVEVFALIESEDAQAVAAAGKDATAVDITYHVLAIAGTLNGQKLNAEQWRKLHETIGSQFALIVRAYTEAKNNPVDARFRR